VELSFSELVSVLDVACRVYSERFSPLGSRLYITKIQDGDDGIYTCKARVAGTQLMIEQETKMFLYGKLMQHVQSITTSQCRPIYELRVMRHNCLVHLTLSHRRQTDSQQPR